MPIFTKSEQKRIWVEARNAAGPRYTKDINVEVPIKELFEGIGRTDKVFEEIEEMRKELIDAFRLLSYKKPSSYKEKVISKNLEHIHTLGKAFVSIVKSFGKDPSKNLDLNSISKQTKKISKYISKIDSFIWEVERKENDEQREKAEAEKKEYFGHSQSEYLRELKGLENNLNKFNNKLRDMEYFSRSYKAKLFNDPFLLILGQAGMGKTHLVCDVTKDRINRELAPTVIVLGEKLLEIKDSLNSIFKACSLNGSKKNILEELNSIGEQKKSRSLIIVDAINEADRPGWKSEIRNLIKEIKKYPWIGLVMTCRIPFQHLSLPKRFHIITEYHQGFAENELEAMTLFFKFYNIPLPEVPLLISEFSSPLFLSCFCKTARDIRGGKARIAKNIKDLALGQVGMTKILEDFYKTKEREIIKKHAGQFKSLVKDSWIWKKSGADTNECLIKLMAQKMADTGIRYINDVDVIAILGRLSNNKYQEITCIKVLNILVEEGVLVRDATWDGQTKQYVDVIKFSFHKFSDHIIARYLLENHFDSKKVRESLSANNALGSLFQDEETILTNIDLIEALMVEFPERVKKNKKLQEKDLIDFLPTKVVARPEVRSAFIESLYWRKPENFLNDKKVIKKSIIRYINGTLLQYSDSSKDLLDLFVSTATKPFHPLSAKMLNGYLSNFSIVKRDLFWSEYLRKQYSSGSIYKLLSWIEDQNLTEITADQARCVITILGWVLTSNVKLLRTRATRCIYIIGKIQPEVCFKTTIEFCKTNDPYITERMLAASYGVAMTLRNKNDHSFLKILYLFAKAIYSSFFKKNALCGTTNVLIRDYARGIIEAALLHKADLLSSQQIKRTRPPYNDGGLRRWGRNKDKDDGKYREGNAPLGMDFENYTLGSLVPNRNNYDYDNKDFIKLKENVFWRIYQLGYSLEKFGDIDKSIASNTRFDRGPDYAGKVDRYGKKYSWIAYYEIFGLKMDRKEINKSWISEDGRNSDIEIDPSFPETPNPERKRLISKTLTNGPRALKKWLVQIKSPDISTFLQLDKIDDVDGPWILVDGIIEEENTQSKKRITTFIRGLLIDKKDKEKLNEFLASKSFPGNDNIPSVPETRGTFAGEIGWREDKQKADPTYIEIQRGKKKVKLSKTEKQFYNIRILVGDSEVSRERQEPPKYRVEPIYEKIPVELLGRWFISKDYRYLGSDDDGIGLYIPSKRFVKDNNLHQQENSFQLLDQENKLASIPFVRGDQYHTHENLLYLRKDLIDKFLKKTGKRLFLIAWGERRFWPADSFESPKDISQIYQTHKNIYKEIIEYKT